MVDKIEMSLDDIIKSQKSNRPRGGGRGAGRTNRRGGGNAAGAGSSRNGFRAGQRNGGASGGGGVLKGRGRGGISRARYGRGDVNSAWKHDMYEGPRKNRLLTAGGLGGAVGGVPGGTSKLMVSNLDFGVSETDINELFAEFGPLKSASVHYDRSGRSLGTADVIFERRSDAIKAMKQYNGVPLDGRPMSIQMATSEIPAPRIPRPAALSMAARSPRKPTVGRGGGKPTTRGGRGGNSSRGRQPRETKTAEELDAELDAYTKDMK
ncbi:THO complex subunit 4 [Anopheles nili]|uniref:THO complex subunit 4 n=1 Tax=Anopheles nili TaxID=185578 RepID=UPI00237BB232|nr:THO complex subunit 4 [Anopheles nili]